MITIDQKQFDERDIDERMGLGENKQEFAGKSVLSKQVKKVYQKVIQSMELYTADNLPIITEFLEF